MGLAHRIGDQRICGAVTVPSGNTTVTVNDKLWAVAGDPDSHGSGALIASVSDVTCMDKPVIIKNDSAEADDLCIPIGPPHCDPIATGSSNDVSAA